MPRIGVPVQITLVRRNERLTFATRDLSRSGARLVGHGHVAEGEYVRIEIAFANALVTLDATVARTDPQNAQVSVEFRPPSAETAAVLERELATLVDRTRTGAERCVIAIGLVPQTADALGRDLAQLGRRLHACVSMEEVKTALVDDEGRCDAVVVAAGADNLGPLLRWLVEHHPRVRRVLLHGEQLASIDHEASSRIEAVLRTPWRIRALARGLGIALPDASIALLPQNE